MPFIEQAGGSEASEGQVVPSGEGYSLVCKEAEHNVEKFGVALIIGIETDVVTNPADIFHFISLVKPDDDEKKSTFKHLMQQRTCQAFGVEYNDGFDYIEFVGKKATLALDQDSYKNELKNILVLPKVRETTEGTSGNRRRR